MSLVDTKQLIRLVILSMTSSRWDKKHEEADGREEKKAEDDMEQYLQLRETAPQASSKQPIVGQQSSAT